MQVGRAGRFGTKGLAITCVSTASDSDVLNQVEVGPSICLVCLLVLFDSAQASNKKDCCCMNFRCKNGLKWTSRSCLSRLTLEHAYLAGGLFWMYNLCPICLLLHDMIFQCKEESGRWNPSLKVCFKFLPACLLWRRASAAAVPYFFSVWDERCLFC